VFGMFLQGSVSYSVRLLIRPYSDDRGSDLKSMKGDRCQLDDEGSLRRDHGT
jgi:hypothetical protein